MGHQGVGDMKRVWLVRLGRHGEFEASAIHQSRLTLGFNSDRADLSDARDREALLPIMARLHPSAKPTAQANYAAQLNQFINIAQTGDLVITPFKMSSTISIGRLSGPYERDPDGRACRRVEWLQQDIPRDAFHQDLLYSFGAIQTVCEISRNNALARIEVVIRTRSDPGDGVMPAREIGGAAARPPQHLPDRLERRPRPLWFDHRRLGAFQRMEAARRSGRGQRRGRAAAERHAGA